MDAANPTPPPPSPPPPPPPTVVDAPHLARHGSSQSPDTLPVAVVAQPRISTADAFGSPVVRSPRLSRLPPPQPPGESQDDSSDDESESINDVALHLSRDETPENDDLFPDEPSTVLASKIIRAHDNPSPPPQDLAHPGISYVPGKDGQFPPSSISVPPSPFRPINILERLNQSSDPVFEPSRSHQTLGVQSDITEPDTTPPAGSISPKSSSPFISTTSALTNSTPYVDLASTDTTHSSTTQCTFNDPILHSSQHMTITSSRESMVRSLPSTQAVTSSLKPPIPSPSDDCLREPLPCSEHPQSIVKSSPLLPKAKTLSFRSSNMPSSSTETMAPGDPDNDGEKIESKNSLLPSKGEQESKHRAKGMKEVDTSPPQRLDSLSPQSTSVLAGLYLSSELAPSIEQMVLPAKSIPIKPPLMPLPRTPIRAVPHPDFSRTSVQRPVIAPTPMRADSARKLNSPTRFSLQVDNLHRTPAKRVPIETTLARGLSSLQRRTRPTESEQSRPGHSQTIRAPVFMRPALDDPSRSPAKRIATTDFATSPTKGYQSQSSPTRLVLRARSASVEPRPSAANVARSRSVEPCATISKTDNHGKIKESLFPMLPILPRISSRLPFPLVSGQKSDLPPPIPEEPENAGTGSSEADAAQGIMTQGKMMSQLRQPSINSRIPRIGNKPYARPPKNGRTVVGTTAGDATRVSRAPTFRSACKDSGAGNSNVEVSSTQPVGSLKRKRGTEATTHANSHPVMLRQVVPGILNDKYAPKPAKTPSQVQVPLETSSPKVPQPLKFRRVVDGMLSARYPPAKPNIARTELSDSTSPPPSPLSELSSSSNEESTDEKLLSTTRPHAGLKGETPDTPRIDVDVSVVQPSAQEHFSLHQDADNEPSSRPRRTSRTRKPAQQQYVLDVFNNNTSTRPPPSRRRPQPRTEVDCFMGMSATALKALTTSHTTKNQKTVAILATEVIRKEGLRPESPTVKARTILQKQRDERDMRRRERAQRRARMSDDSFQGKEVQTELEDSRCADGDENEAGFSQKHFRGPGDEEDYETPERPERIIEPLKLEGMGGMVKPAKQVKWHRGLSTAVYVDEVNPKPKSLPRSVIVRGCLAPTSKDLPLDHLGNLVDMDNRPFPELAAEHVVVKRYLYDNDMEPEPIPAPAKMTRSKSKKSKS